MNKNWLNRILNYTATPPKGVWDNIASTLQEEENNTAGFTYKILDYQIAPPPVAMANIFAVLDNEEHAVSALPATDKIQQYTQEPPDAVWNNMNASLDKKEPAAVIQLNPWVNKLKIIYRIAAAAAVFAVILISILLNRKKTAVDITPVATIKTATNPTSVIADTNKAPVLSAAETASLNKISATHKKNAIPPTFYPFPDTMKYSKGIDIADLATDPRKTGKEKLKNADGQTPEDIGLINTPNSYISITGPDGKSVKVSSKFSSLIGYLKEQNPETLENIDIIIKESAEWRATFTKWRNKMTNNTVAPSLGNFMDIIELSKILEEKK
ncbi:MAG: hypothetical protein WCI49_04305 [Ferruginibacter sp.]